MDNVVDLNLEKWAFINLPCCVDIAWDLAFPLFPTSLLLNIKSSEEDYKNIRESHIFAFEKFKRLLKSFDPLISYNELQHIPHIIAFPVHDSWQIIGYCFKYDNGYTYLAVPDYLEKPVLMLLSSLWKSDKGFTEIEYIIVAK